MKHIAALITSPSYALAFFSVVHFLHGKSNIKITLFIYWSAINSDEVTLEYGLCVRDFTRCYSDNLRIIEIMEGSIDTILSSGAPDEIAAEYRNEFNIKSIDEFYYGHATMGCFVQLTAGVFPDAKRICFGDGFGLVHLKRARMICGGFEFPAHPTLTANEGQKVIQWACEQFAELKGLTTLRELLAQRELLPDEAVLSLPVDQFGDFLEKVPLRICPKHYVRETLKECYLASILSNYLASLMSSFANKKKGLMLTANYAEAEDLSLSNEVAMYASLIRKSFSAGTVVFIKPHPGEFLERFSKLKELIGADYELVQLNKEFSCYPIELWVDLIKESIILSMSYPSVTLSYFYNKKIHYLMSHELIEKWWSKPKQKFRKDARSWHTETIRNLNRWDGKSPLYSACLISLRDYYISQKAAWPLSNNNEFNEH